MQACEWTSLLFGSSASTSIPPAWAGFHDLILKEYEGAVYITETIILVFTNAMKNFFVGNL